MANLEPWIRTWWGEILTSLSAKYWFEHKGDNLMWDPPPDASDTILELLLELQLQQPYKSHLMVVPQLMIFFLEKVDGEGGRIDVYCHCWDALLGIGRT